MKGIETYMLCNKTIEYIFITHIVLVLALGIRLWTHYWLFGGSLAGLTFIQASPVTSVMTHQ